MGQILHGNARATEKVRRSIQDSQESLARVSKRSNLNPQTIANWEKHSFSHYDANGTKHLEPEILT